MGEHFKYHRLLLFYKDKFTDAEFQRSRAYLDLQTLRFVLTIGIFISLIFLFYDIYRFESIKTSLIFRGGFSMSLFIFLFLIKFLDQRNYKAIQLFIGFIVLIGVSIGFGQSVFMQNHPIFLSNFLSSIFFVSSTIFGLRYRYIILLNTLAFIAYFIHIHLIGFDLHSHAFMQIPQLSTFYFIGIISAYVLELHKMKLFKKECLLKNQFSKVADLNHVKDRLFRTISHDIRGPILNLKGVTSLYRKRHISDKELIDLVSSLDKEVTKTSNLIDNLLAWSKSQLEGFEIHKSVFDIQKLVNDALETYDYLIAEKNLKVQVELDSSDKVFAEKEMMLIIIRNLLCNAIKFTPIGGEIKISGKSLAHEKCYELKIIDNGTGIDDSKLKHLFDVSHSQLLGNTSASGSGLGLNLVKEFVDLNGGEISCKSKIGQGTTFIIKMPQPETS